MKIHDSETPAHGQQKITACAFIYQYFEGTAKVFLPRRSAQKKFLPNVYELPGGHIDFGEELETDLKREINEEFNITIEVKDILSAFTYTNNIKGSHTVEIVYLATFTDPPANITLNPEDLSEYEWFSSEEIDTIKDNNTTYLDSESDPEIEIIKL